MAGRCSAREGYVSASANTLSVTNGGVYWICLYRGDHQRGNRSPRCRSGMAGATWHLEVAAKVRYVSNLTPNQPWTAGVGGTT